MNERILDEKLQKDFAGLSHFEQLEVTSEIPREAAYIDALLFRNGDVILHCARPIAVTAAHHNLSLVNRDSHLR